jgi:hypothetical protein
MFSCWVSKVLIETIGRWLLIEKSHLWGMHFSDQGIFVISHTNFVSPSGPLVLLGQLFWLPRHSIMAMNMPDIWDMDNEEKMGQEIWFWPQEGIKHKLPLMCHTSVIMPYSHSIKDIQQISKWPLPDSKLQPSKTHSWRLSICKLFTKTHLIHMTTSEESLRVLFFTHSLVIDLIH